MLKKTRSRERGMEAFSSASVTPFLRQRSGDEEKRGASEKRDSSPKWMQGAEVIGVCMGDHRPGVIIYTMLFVPGPA